MGGRKVDLHLSVCEQSASRSDRFTREDRIPHIHWTRDWLGPRAEMVNSNLCRCLYTKFHSSHKISDGSSEKSSLKSLNKLRPSRGRISGTQSYSNFCCSLLRRVIYKSDKHRQNKATWLLLPHVKYKLHRTHFHETHAYLKRFCKK